MSKLEASKYVEFNNKKYYGRGIFIIILIVNIIYFALTRNPAISHLLLEFLSTTILLVISVISISRYTNREDNFFSYVGITFVIVTFLQVIHVAYSVRGIPYQLTVILGAIVNFIEYLIIPFSLYSYKKKIKYTLHMKISFVVALISAMFILIVYTYFLKYGIFKDFKLFIKISLFVSSILFWENILLVYFSKDIKNSEKKYLVLFIIFLGGCELISKIMYFKYFGYPKNLYFISHVFKYLSFYIIYEAVCEFMVNDIFNRIYKELLNIEKERAYYNKILNDRLNLYLELKLMIEKSKGKYNDLINSISDVVIIFQNDRIKYLNKAAIEFSFIMGTKSRKSIKKEDLLKMLPIKKNNDRYSFSIENKFGDVREYEIKDFKIDESSNMVFIKDVTEYKKIKSLKSELHNYLIEENLKRDFFSNISHELRTPVNVIFSALQLNDIYIVDTNYNGIHKNNKKIKQNCLRLIRTINNFIETNKITEGYLNPNYEKVNVVEVIENVAELSYAYMNKKNINFTFDSVEEEIFINCDKEFLEKIYLNLLSNSVKYSEENGNVLTDITLEDNFVTIKVLNDSNIIDAEDKEEIFEIFSKVSTPFFLRKEGSGLGLFISKSLAELMDGEILLDTSYKGNAFMIKFKTVERDKNYYDLENPYSYNINDLKEKVNIEFSDIYVD